MYANAYDIVASSMRYFFLLLIIYILLRLVQHSFSEFRAVQQIKKRVRSVSPGYLEALLPEEFLGRRFPLGRENTIGRSKRCNISIPLPSLAPTHAFIYEKKGGLYISDYGSRQGVLLNDERIGRHEEYLYTEDKLQFGGFICVLHLSGEEEDDV